MAQTRIHICDYGSGNILSVERGLDKVGAEVVRCTSPDELTDVRGLIIPGVGAFADCMRGVRERGFEQPIHQLVEQGAWVLGICVGMQILATESEEFGITKGLGIVPGTVKQLPETAPDGSRLKRPHVGWSELHPVSQPWAGTPFERIADGTAAYFVHSFHLVPDDRQASARRGQLRGDARHGRGSDRPRVRRAIPPGEEWTHRARLSRRVLAPGAVIMKSIVVFGAQGQAKVAVEAIEQIGTHRIIGFVADGPLGFASPYPVLGTDADIARLWKENGPFDAHIAVGDVSIRRRIADRGRARSAVDRVPADRAPARATGEERRHWPRRVHCDRRDRVRRRARRPPRHPQHERVDRSRLRARRFRVRRPERRSRRHRDRRR